MQSPIVVEGEAEQQVAVCAPSGVLSPSEGRPGLVKGLLSGQSGAELSQEPGRGGDGMERTNGWAWVSSVPVLRGLHFQPGFPLDTPMGSGVLSEPKMELETGLSNELLVSPFHPRKHTQGIVRMKKRACPFISYGCCSKAPHARWSKQ